MRYVNEDINVFVDIFNYYRRHLFWFPFFGIFSMKSCTDLLNLNIVNIGRYFTKAI